MSVSLPGADHRIYIVGSTGSGKTFAGVFHLSLTDFDTNRPAIIFDFKRDKLLNSLGATEIDVNDKPPTKPGLYIVHPVPEEDDEAVTQMMRRIWSNEDTIVYIDEGYMVGNRNKALNLLLTQGRSKHVQMIILSQRPVWVSRFVRSEADFFQIFRLNDQSDYDTIQGMISVDIRERLPKYHSHYYDVSNDAAAVFGPVPNRKALIENFRTRLKRKPRII